MFNKNTFFVGVPVMVLLSIVLFQNCGKGFQAMAPSSRGNSQSASASDTGNNLIAIPATEDDVPADSGSTAATVGSGAANNAVTNTGATNSGITSSGMTSAGTGTGSSTSSNSNSSATTMSSPPEPIAPPARSCLFNGNMIADGQPVTAYQNGNDSAGNCVAQSRVCHDGLLYGTYRFGSCVMSDKKSCVFNGVTFKNGESFKGYREVISGPPEVKSCASKTLTCDNGNVALYDVDNSTVNLINVAPYDLLSCDASVPQRSCIVDGVQYAHGSVVTVTYGADQSTSTIAKINAGCDDGNILILASDGGAFASSVGKFTNMSYLLESGVPTSMQALSCNMFPTSAASVRHVAHGEKVRVFANAQSDLIVRSGHPPCASTAKEELCNNGTLQDTAGGSTYGSSGTMNCVDLPAYQPAAGAVCNWYGTTVAEGGSVLGYAQTEIHGSDTCAMHSMMRTCNGGKLNEAGYGYDFKSCTADVVGKSCTFDGATLVDGQQIKTYRVKTCSTSGCCDVANGISPVDAANGYRSGNYVYCSNGTATNYGGLPYASCTYVAAPSGGTSTGGTSGGSTSGGNMGSSNGNLQGAALGNTSGNSGSGNTAGGTSGGGTSGGTSGGSSTGTTGGSSSGSSSGSSGSIHVPSNPGSGSFR